jgi:hypothetical protein
MRNSADEPPDPAYCLEIDGERVPFCKLVEMAGEVAADRLEAEVVRRAVEGVDRPVWYQGKVVGHVKDLDPILLMFALKARRPRFKDNHKVEVDVQHSGRIEIDSARERLAQKLEMMLLERATEPETIDAVPVRPALGHGGSDD